MRRLTLLCAVAVLLPVAGCGGGPATTDAGDAADQELAARIDRSRERHAREAAREQARPLPKTQTVDAQDALPAGSGEIDGAGPGGALLSGADRRSFAELARGLGGDSGVAVSPLGRGQDVETLGGMRSAIAWSTSKVPIAMAVIAAGRSGAQADLARAITASDNGAAERLWAGLGGGAAAARAADAQLRAAGDSRTRMQPERLRPGFTPFGQTVWRLDDQARFTAGMACTDEGAQVLGLMGQVVPGQRWGLGAAGADAQLKGGWGPGIDPGVDGGYQDRQMGVLTIRGRPVAVAIATRPADGSHETGTAHLTAIARWLVAHVDAERVPREPRC